MNLRESRKKRKTRKNFIKENIKKGKGKLSDVEKLLEQQKININKIRREIANFAKNKHIATRISQRKKNPTDIYVPSNFKAKKTSKTSKSKK